MIGRVLTIQFQPEKIEELTRVTQQSLVPVFERLPGFKGGWWLADYVTGKAVQITLWDSEADIQGMADSPERTAVETQQIYPLLAADPAATFENFTVIAQALADRT